VILCTAANGQKFPLAVIAKPKTHVSFRLWTNGKGPIAYANECDS